MNEHSSACVCVCAVKHHPTNFIHQNVQSFSQKELKSDFMVVCSSACARRWITVRSKRCYSKSCTQNIHVMFPFQFFSFMLTKWALPHFSFVKLHFMQSLLYVYTKKKFFRDYRTNSTIREKWLITLENVEEYRSAQQQRNNNNNNKHGGSSVLCERKKRKPKMKTECMHILIYYRNK